MAKISTCDALVVCCIDFRFQKFIRKWTDEHLKDKLFDLVAVAGATKDLYSDLKQIDISKGLHKIHHVDLIHHEDCGAYGAEGKNKDLHASDLRKAKSRILALYPDLTVHMFYLRLDGTFEAIPDEPAITSPGKQTTYQRGHVQA